MPYILFRSSYDSSRALLSDEQHDPIIRVKNYRIGSKIGSWTIKIGSSYTIRFNFRRSDRNFDPIRSILIIKLNFNVQISISISVAFLFSTMSTIPVQDE
uniref:Uncharacterized protein n=1 Tax=Cacopsylla melanoneura TaxID=428564 RepID=A0A8D8ZL09_9HEMI